MAASPILPFRRPSFSSSFPFRMFFALVSSGIRLQRYSLSLWIPWFCCFMLSLMCNWFSWFGFLRGFLRSRIVRVRVFVWNVLLCLLMDFCFSRRITGKRWYFYGFSCVFVGGFCDLGFFSLVFWDSWVVGGGGWFLWLRCFLDLWNGFGVLIVRVEHEIWELFV